MDLSKIIMVSYPAPPKKERMSFPLGVALLDDLATGAIMDGVWRVCRFWQLWTNDSRHILSHAIHALSRIT